MEVDTLLGVLNGIIAMWMAFTSRDYVQRGEKRLGIIAFLLGLFNLSMFLYLVVLKGGS